MMLAGFSYAVQKDNGDKKSENPIPHDFTSQTPNGCRAALLRSGLDGVGAGIAV